MGMKEATQGATEMPTTFEFSDTDSRCYTCQADEQAERHGFDSMTQQQRNHWAMWGCTCTTEQAEEAQAFMNMMTR